MRIHTQTRRGTRARPLRSSGLTRGTVRSTWSLPTSPALSSGPRWMDTPGTCDNKEGDIPGTCCNKGDTPGTCDNKGDTPGTCGN